MGKRGRGLMGSMDARINDLIRNPGLPSDVMDASRASLLAANKSGTKNAILRRAGQGSARGIFDSGLTQMGIQDIEASMHGEYMDALQQLEMTNAMQALQGLGLASSHLLGKKGLNIQRMLGLENIGLQRELGKGQLGLGWAQHADNQAWREFQMNLIAQGYSPYGGGGGGALPGATAALANIQPGSSYGGGPRGGGRGGYA